MLLLKNIAIYFYLIETISNFDTGFKMVKIIKLIFNISVLILAMQNYVHAERLAILNWETKAPESLDSLSLSEDKGREEGIAIIELDKNSKDYGKILINIPVDPSLILHHIFYNQDLSKAYITALAGNNLYYINLLTGL